MYYHYVYACVFVRIFRTRVDDRGAAYRAAWEGAMALRIATTFGGEHFLLYGIEIVFKNRVQRVAKKNTVFYYFVTYQTVLYLFQNVSQNVLCRVPVTMRTLL